MLNKRLTGWFISLGLALLWVGSVGGRDGMKWVVGVMIAGLIIELAIVGVRALLAE